MDHAIVKRHWVNYMQYEMVWDDRIINTVEQLFFSPVVIRLFNFSLIRRRQKSTNEFLTCILGCD